MTAAEDSLSRPQATKKSAEAFRTISEVASELDLPQHVLRFWETKFTTVKPMKRGGGRRFYRPEDVALLRQIRNLLYDDGYTIKGAQKLLREGGGKVAPPETPEPAPVVPKAAAGTAPLPENSEPAPGQANDGLKAELQSILGELEDIRSMLNA